MFRLLSVILATALLLATSACQSTGSAGKTGTGTAGTTGNGGLPVSFDFDDERDASRPSDPLLAHLWKYGNDSFYIINRSVAIPDPIMLGTTLLAKSGSGAQTVRNADGSTTTTMLGSSSWQAFIQGANETAHVASLPTAVHETLHGYTTRFPLAELAGRHKNVSEILVPDPERPNVVRIPSYYAYYTGRNSTLVTLKKSTSPAREIAGRIPQELRTFRFATYVTSQNQAQSTQLSGIHGLLDEYNAYYWSLRTASDLYGYFRDKKAGDVAAIKTWVHEIAGVYGAWAEFRYWILVWFEHVRDNYPEQYRALLADRTFREAFTAIDDNWLALFPRVRKQLATELTALLKKGNIATGFSERPVQTGGMTQTGTYLRVGNTLIYLGDAQIRLLGPVMQQKKYLDLANTLRTTRAPGFPAKLPTGS